MPKQKKKYYHTTVYVKDALGNPHVKTVNAKTKKELQEKVAETKRLYKNQKRVYEKDTFGFWAEKWLTECYTMKDVSQSQFKNQKSNIKMLNDRFKDKELKNITIDEFQDFINEVQKTGLRGNPLAKSSVQKIIYTAHEIFKWAIAHNVIATDFFNHITIPKDAGAEKRRALTESEQQMIIDTPHRAQLPAMIMLFAGLRRGEVCGLMWKDIDLENGLIYVANQTLDLKTGTLKDGGKTRNAKRVVPIPPILIDYLSEYRANAKTLGLYVCLNTKGGLFKTKAFENMWNSYLRELNVKYGYNGTVSKYNPKKLPMRIDEFTPHYLRHTFATLLYLQGVDPVKAKEYLGHEKIQTTIDIYTDFKTLNRSTLSDEYKQRLNNEYKVKTA